MITIANHELPNFLQTPFNPVTNREFRGANRSNLQDVAIEKGFKSPEWATLKQWNSIKECIAKRQAGTKIVVPGKDGSITAFVYNREQLVVTEPKSE